jgi:phage terminase small subunit
MTPVTEMQEAFCLAYIETGNASEAYRRVYSTKNMRPTTVNRNAKKLMDNNKIKTRLAEIRAPVLKASCVTLEGHLSKLDALGKAALRAGHYSAAINAEIARGKASGFYIVRTEITGKDGGPVKVGATIDEKISINNLSLEEKRNLDAALEKILSET